MFGIRVPNTLKESYEIKRKPGTEFWIKSIVKEMENIHRAFEKIDSVTPNKMRKGKIRPGYKHVNVHMIFDIKMDGKLTRK